MSAPTPPGADEVGETWGPGLFENDDAMDFFDDLLDEPDRGLVEAALGEASRPPEGLLPPSSAAAALAAAELVAAALGHPAADLPGELGPVLRGLRGLDALAPLAQAAVDGASGERSALRGLWAAEGELDAWLAGVGALKARLAAGTPAPKAPSRSTTGRPRR